MHRTVKKIFLFTSLFACSIFFTNVSYGQSSKHLTSYQQKSGFYVTGHIGASMLFDADMEGTNINVENDFDTGLDIGAAIGYRYNNRFRFEIEGLYKENDVDQITLNRVGAFGLPSGGTTGSDGKVSASLGLLNMYIDFPEISLARSRVEKFITPYAMGGLGFGKLRSKISSLDVQLIHDHDIVYAYQLGAGVNFNVTRKTAVEIGYRYLQAQKPSYTDTLTGKLSSEYFSHTGRLGMSYKF